MSGLFERLVHELPERYAPTKSSFATDAKSLRAWLAQLPLANPGATARLLIGALREMNQLRVDPQQRLDALELLRKPIEQIVSTLTGQIFGDRFPLPAQKLQLGRLANDFERELALGYISVAYDFCAPAGAVPFMRAKPVALALTRAIQHRGACLYQAYLRYDAPSAGTWRSLHDLFRFAVGVDVDTRANPDPLLADVQISARQAYMHALLFALSNPYRFTQRENAEIHVLTRVWATHCELREGRAPDGAIAVRVDSDSSLGYLPEERETPGDGLWALEINALIRVLQGRLAKLPADTGQISFNLRGGPVIVAQAAFVERLMSLWESHNERNHQRLAAGYLMDTVIGLHDLHYVLADNEDFEAFLLKTRGVAVNLYENEHVPAWANTSINGNAKVRRLQANVLDQSLSGYRLAWDNIEGMRVRVGELIGLAAPAEDGEAQDWMIGVIRWLRIDSDGAMEAGIELLARRALPIAVRSIDSKGRPRTAMRGISLESIDTGGDVAAIEVVSIMVPQTFDAGASEIELTHPADPLAWPSEPRVEHHRGLRAVNCGGGYLRLETGGPNPDGSRDGVGASAANDDSPADPDTAASR